MTAVPARETSTFDQNRNDKSGILAHTTCCVRSDQHLQSDTSDSAERGVTCCEARISIFASKCGNGRMSPQRIHTLLGIQLQVV